jgi:pimeloyl-ACP methyl ester carboxylesterase
LATTTVNGVELYYEVRGTGDCLVLTHGSWTDATGWEQAVARLSDRYRVVVCCGASWKGPVIQL